MTQPMPGMPGMPVALPPSPISPAEQQMAARGYRVVPLAAQVGHPNLLRAQQPAQVAEVTPGGEPEGEESQESFLGTLALQGLRGAGDFLTMGGALTGAALQGAGNILGLPGLEHFGEQLGESASGGAAIAALAATPEIVFGKGMTAAEHYDAAREKLERQQEEHPLLSGVAHLAGLAAAAVITGGLAAGEEAAAGTGFLARAAPEAALAATEGGALGAQEAYERAAPVRDLLSHIVVGAAIGGALSLGVQGAGAGLRKLAGAGEETDPLLGKVFGKAKTFAQSHADEFADERALKAAGFSRGELNKLGGHHVDPSEVAETLRDYRFADGARLLTMDTSPSRGGYLGRLRQALRETGGQLGVLRQQVDELAAGHPDLAPDIQTIWGKIRATVIEPLEKSDLPADHAMAKRVQAQFANLLDEDAGPMTFSRLHEFEQRLGQHIRPRGVRGRGIPPPTPKAAEYLEAAERTLSRELDTSVRETMQRAGQDPAAYDALQQTYSHLKVLQQVGENAKSQFGNRIISPSDYMTGVGVLASGHPVGAVASALAHKVMRERGSAVAAVIADRIAKSGAANAAEATAVALQTAAEQDAAAASPGLGHALLSRVAELPGKTAETAAHNALSAATLPEPPPPDLHARVTGRLLGHVLTGTMAPAARNAVDMAGAKLGVEHVPARTVAEYGERIERLIALRADPEALTRIGETAQRLPVPHPLQAAAAEDSGAKLQRLIGDLPKPAVDLLGRQSLSRQDLARGNAMIAATMSPMSVFDDFVAGTIDYTKAQYAWAQYPGLQAAGQAAIIDQLQRAASQGGPGSIAPNLVTQLDFLMGFNGRLSYSVDRGFAMRMSAAPADETQGRPAPVPFSNPRAKRTFTERLSGE